MSIGSAHFLPKSGFVRFVSVFLIIVVFFALLIVAVWESSPKEPEVFVGVMAGFMGVEEIITFVDEVEDYVNLIIISDLNVTTNSTSLYEVLDHLATHKLYFIPFMRFFEFVDDPDFFQVARERWGKYFLGLYVFDEPGGKQMDLALHRPVNEAEDYSDAASKFTDAVAREGLLTFVDSFNMVGEFTIFTSDYALYWFDYSSCYNVVLSQFGWNHSRQVDTALCRGAATGHNSEWGAVITWTYEHPPYLESPEMLYDDMVLAYNNGAKYITVFNFPTNLTEFGLLTQGHLDMMQKFWQYQRNNPQPKNPAEVAYVLPEAYGYGFRGPNDKIWGLWGPDELSPKVWNDVTSLLESYESKLDVIYDNADPSIKQQYNLRIYWNGTQISNE